MNNCSVTIFAGVQVAFTAPILDLATLHIQGASYATNAMPFHSILSGMENSHTHNIRRVA